MAAMSIDRKEQLKELDNFIQQSKIKLTSIISTLGWSIESVSKNAETMVVCPFNQLHRIPERSLEKHLEDCQWKAEGYGKEDLPLSIPSLPPGAPSCIKFDEQLQDEVIQNAKLKNPSMAIGAGGRLIPRTSNRLTSDFTRDERCAIYEYVIANTLQPDIGEDIADMNKPKVPGDGNSISYLELQAQERNLKRRRAKYRGVHTNKKSQVEILREVINQQMEMLTECITDNKDDWDTTNNLSNRHERYDRQNDKSREKSSLRNSVRSDNFTEDRGFSICSDSDNRQHQSRITNRSDDRNSNKGTSNDRGNICRDRSNERSKRYFKERSHTDSKSRNSSDRKSHKSHHKKDKHKSKDRHGERHKRHRSRDRDRSHSSRDTKHNHRNKEKRRKSRD